VLHRILLIQEDHTNAGAIQDALVSSEDAKFEVIWARRCADGLHRLGKNTKERSRQHGIDAVLLDLALADCSGIETFDRVFAMAPQIPILVLISADDEASGKLAVQNGAQDYLRKDRIDTHSLLKALRSMFERAANTAALFEEKERAQVTLNSIGDAVISTDLEWRVTFLNGVAERLTGWSRDEALGRPVDEVFNIADGSTGIRARNPMVIAVLGNATVSLTPNCVLIRRDGTESPIEDSAAPIHDRHGRTTGAVVVFHDVSAARAQSLRISYLAQHDSLTDLPNRLLLNDRLGQALAMAHRACHKLALLFLDVDRFKSINDSMGHAIGDRLLQSVAQRLLACVRSSDTVSRQGGDEFVILLAQVSHPQDAAISAEKILAALGAPHHIGKSVLHVTASIGIVTFPDDGVDAEILLKNADFAMYRAKESGRNCYQFFKPEMNENVVERLSMESGLRSAVERQELMLYYQPKVNLRTGTIVGVEALLRWRHPSYGILPPAAFMAIAEESGLIVPIGRWVLRESCRQTKAWEEAGLMATHIAINVSAVELRAPNFAAGIRSILQETALDPYHLELELTETFLMQDANPATTVLQALKDLGVRIALDDFGTGYSSLSYVRRFAVDTLKIDASLVSGLGTNTDNAAMVSAIINMGKSLHMQVVAEGVETHEQLKFLQEQDCPEAQGYYLGRPVSGAEIARLLKQNMAGVAARA
jgi:diguanylate cyclase (GGDEF)-like protein/PAS domain S-box-containing protein